MTKEEAKIWMAADGIKPAKDYRGRKVLEPIYDRWVCIGPPMYAGGDGSPDGWEIAYGKEGYKIYLYQLRAEKREAEKAKQNCGKKYRTTLKTNRTK